MSSLLCHNADHRVHVSSALYCAFSYCLVLALEYVQRYFKVSSSFIVLLLCLLSIRIGQETSFGKKKKSQNKRESDRIKRNCT